MAANSRAVLSGPVRPKSLPGLRIHSMWTRQPALSVLGTETDSWFTDSHELLHSWFPRIDDCIIKDVGHLLHMQRPEHVLSGVAAWLARHPMPRA